MKTKVFFLMVMLVLMGAGCTRSVSTPIREIASEFVSYFAGKELLDPILYPDKSKEERDRLREELGKELFNHIWADFGESCRKEESLRSCKRRISKRLRDWTELYTNEFISLYRECEEAGLHQRYKKIDLVKRFESAEECVIAKDSKYSTLFDLSRNIQY